MRLRSPALRTPRVLVPTALVAGVLVAGLAAGAHAADSKPHYAQLTPVCSQINAAMHTVYSNTDIAVDMVGLLPALTTIVSRLPASDPVAASIQKMSADRADPAAVVLDRATMVAACSEEAKRG